ncbi:MAG: CAP domain-containing protein [Pyrinomonadaceae bacterium]
MKFIFLLLITAILTVTAFGQVGFVPAGYSRSVGSSFASEAVTPAAARALERDAFQLINAERARSGLTTLSWNDKIAGVARLHSGNMARFNFFSHRGLDGRMVDERADELNMGPWRAIGENIAFMKGFDDPVAMAVEKWLNSPGHRKNLLNPDWTETGVGLSVTQDGKYYFTQVFIRN